MQVTQIRAYGTENLLLTQTVSVDAPSGTTLKHAKSQLITDTSNRSCYPGKLPYIDEFGSQWEYEAYKVDKNDVTNDLWKATFTWGQEYFQHAILLVVPKTDLVIAETFRIYIGNSADYTQCTECTGGPFNAP